MNFKYLIYSILLPLILIQGSCVRHKPTGIHGKPPNIMIILADDMGYSDLGCFGGEISTPNIDDLAVNGLRFTQFYNTARCWPTRSSLMTGYYYQAIFKAPDVQACAWSHTIPHLLGPLGYKSYHSGKWHIRELPNPLADAGFKHSYRVKNHNNYFNPRIIKVDNMRVPYQPDRKDYYATTAIADCSIKYLKEHESEYPENPFFMYVAFTSPHFPLHALQEDVEKYRETYLEGWDKIREARLMRMHQMHITNCQLAEPEPDARWHHHPDSFLIDTLGQGEVPAYVPWEKLNGEQKKFQAEKMAIHAAMVYRMDREIGRIIKQLKESKEFDNTVIFILSDNGASAEMLVRAGGHDRKVPMGSENSFLCLGPGWSWASNTPFRRSKIWVHEGGISTPLIVHWPNGIKTGNQLRRNQGHVVDLMPTVLELAGVDSSGTRQETGECYPELHGQSLVPAFNKDGSVVHNFIFFKHKGNHALIAGNWKIVSSGLDKGVWELFNLREDRNEQNDLSDQLPDRLHSMITKWEKLSRQYEVQRTGE